MTENTTNPPRHIIITGASSGIGAALARQYARPGAVLGLLGRNRTALESIAESCQQQGAQTLLGSIDVTDAAALKHWISTFDRDYPVDLLFANAGVSSSTGPNGEMESWETVNALLNTNFHGVVNTIYPLLDVMRQRRHGHIVLVSSLAAYRGLPLMPAYCASKAALKSYGEALRGLLRRDNVKVSVICPGFVASQMTDRFPGPRPFLMSAEKAAAIIQKGIIRNRACVSFPFPLNLGMKLLAWLPANLADTILSALHYGGSRK
ncbi:MAG: SDR family NAD(P)-dependent oxidoreductase [Gammaproteobacteria bacterium]